MSPPLPEPTEVPPLARAMLLVRVVQAIATIARAIAEWLLLQNRLD
jgi:hypothetical protein